jgi:hypothetical protein
LVIGLLSAFGRFLAHFVTNMNKNHKMPFNRPSGDLRLSYSKIQIKNTKSPFIGRRPFLAHFLTNLNLKHKIPFYRPPADLGLILQQN